MTTKKLDDLKEIYEACGYPVVLASAKQGEGIEEIKSELQGKTTTVLQDRAEWESLH